jgi:hypothetical protein
VIIGKVIKSLRYRGAQQKRPTAVALLQLVENSLPAPLCTEQEGAKRV